MPTIRFLTGSAAGSLFGLGLDSIFTSWTPSVTPGVVQYNVYRSQTTGGPYSLIGTAPTSNNGAQLGYTDFAVARGTTYFYVVTAFDGANESIFSNEASATSRL